MTFEEAFDAYMTVSGRERSAAYQDKLMFRFFQKNFGRNFPIIDITPKLISRCISVLRGKLITRKGQRVPLTPATINRHVQFLQRVWNFAKDLNEPVQNIRWKAFILVEAEQHMSPLTQQEEEYVLNNIDKQILPLFQFSVLTGVRLRNAIGLRWSMIDWSKGEITFRGKSRRPGGKTYVIPITKSVARLIKEQKGGDSTFVFTYIAKRNDKHGHKRGKRYPLTVGVVRYYWEALGLGKRWHDVRHTFGTRLYEVSKDIHLVQRGLNHSNIATTMRYVHADRTDVRDAMEKLDSLSPRRFSPLAGSKVRSPDDPALQGTDENVHGGEAPGQDTSFRKVNKRSAIRHSLFSSGDNENIVNLKDYQRGAVEETRTPTVKTASTSRRCFKDWDNLNKEDK